MGFIFMPGGFGMFCVHRNTARSALRPSRSALCASRFALTETPDHQPFPLPVLFPRFSFTEIGQPALIKA
jgi:hypothetical protein